MKKAFTLIEMIAVIGIIAILVAVLIPVLSGSSESAKAAKCLSNMHALAMGVQARAIETEYYPFAGSLTRYKSTRHSVGTTAVHGWVGWGDESANGSYISPYSDDRDKRYISLTNGAIWRAVSCNNDIYVCPTHHDEALRRKTESPRWSYVMNAWFGWAARTAPYNCGYKGRKYEDVAQKAKTLLFAELPFMERAGNNAAIQDVEFDAAPTTRNDPVLQYQDCDGGGDEIIGFNHKQGKREVYAHVCFADGHTEKLRWPHNPNNSNLKLLTRWLCYPKTDDGKLFDIVFDDDGYKQVEN